MNTGMYKPFFQKMIIHIVQDHIFFFEDKYKQ